MDEKWFQYRVLVAFNGVLCCIITWMKKGSSTDFWSRVGFFMVCYNVLFLGWKSALMDEKGVQYRVLAACGGGFFACSRVWDSLREMRKRFSWNSEKPRKVPQLQRRLSQWVVEFWVNSSFHCVVEMKCWNGSSLLHCNFWFFPRGRRKKKGSENCVPGSKHCRGVARLLSRNFTAIQSIIAVKSWWEI